MLKRLFSNVTYSQLDLLLESEIRPGHIVILNKQKMIDWLLLTTTTTIVLTICINHDHDESDDDNDAIVAAYDDHDDDNAALEMTMMM